MGIWPFSQNGPTPQMRERNNMSNKIKIDAIHSKTIFQGNDNFRVSKWKVIEI